ncbi:MAG: type II secretion system GspH family protein [Puniceicoccales bacterium]|jgi:prepilin-type N-terminal cleavage/methylation domain-containing protein|nr:type II secretion system GspH family protein [Puniceicoccales bacterium]
MSIFSIKYNLAAVRFGEKLFRKRGFSLMEMLLAIGLSGAILVAAMSLMLSLANIYLSAPSFEREIERDIFAEKLIKIFLVNYKSSETGGNVDGESLESGIFFRTDSVPIFVDESGGEFFTLGLMVEGKCLKFAWRPEEGGSFERLTLFDDVRKIHIASYDTPSDSWAKHEFSDAIARKVLETHETCCLVIIRRGGTVTIPLF